MVNEAVKRVRLFMGAVNANGSRDYLGAVVDAGVVAGFTFFSTLGASMVVDNVSRAFLTAVIASGCAFFASLMVSLQIKKPAN